MKYLADQQRRRRFRRLRRGRRRHHGPTALRRAGPARQAAGLPDPRQPPAGRRRPGVAGRRPGEPHAHEDRRGAGVSQDLRRREGLPVLQSAHRQALFLFPNVEDSHGPDQQDRDAGGGAHPRATGRRQTPGRAASTCPNTPGTTSSNSGGRSTWPASAAGTGPQRGSPKTWPVRWTTAAANWKTPHRILQSCPPERQLPPPPTSTGTFWPSTTSSRRWTSTWTSTSFRSRPTASCWRTSISGAFQIRLDWQQLGCSAALSRRGPRSQSGRQDATTSPIPTSRTSISARAKAASAIQAALAECRLHDFFLLVSQLLHTYGRGSAYVELDNWDGVLARIAATP